jgi:hypothetical protein
MKSLLFHLIIFCNLAYGASPLANAFKDKYSANKGKIEIATKKHEFDKDIQYLKNINKIYGNRGSRLNKMLDIFQYAFFLGVFCMPIVVCIMRRNK